MLALNQDLLKQSSRLLALETPDVVSWPAPSLQPRPERPTWATMIASRTFSQTVRVAQMFSPELLHKVFPFGHFTCCLVSSLCVCLCLRLPVWNISTEFILNPEPTDERRSCRGEKRINVPLSANPFISMWKSKRVLSLYPSRTRLAKK